MILGSSRRDDETTLPNRFNLPRTVLIFWLMAAIALPIWVHYDSAGWDLRIYGKALASLQMGHDPYLDATSVQKRHHLEVLANGGKETWSAPPYSYVYSPLTLPLLRVLGHLPTVLLVGGYWLLYAAGALAAIGVGVSLTRNEREYRWMLFAAGVSVFFPGMLANGTVLSGNIAYILYGAAFVAAWIGWHKQRWALFYVVVLLAACVKAPLLSLALIPALSARRQWIPSIATMVAGTGLFASQKVLCPELFRHYLEAVELQFSFNRDFGCSPAGLFSDVLSRHGIPYAPACYLFFAAYALPLVFALLWLSRAYLRQELTLRQWAPVLLCGVILLNPRIMEYDVAPITVPMALVLFRLTVADSRSRLRLVTVAGCLLAMNAASLYSWEWRKVLDGPLLALVVFAGCVQLAKIARKTRAAKLAEVTSLLGT